MYDDAISGFITSWILIGSVYVYASIWLMPNSIVRRAVTSYVEQEVVPKANAYDWGGLLKSLLMLFCLQSFILFVWPHVMLKDLKENP